MRTPPGRAACNAPSVSRTAQSSCRRARSSKKERKRSKAYSPAYIPSHPESHPIQADSLPQAAPSSGIRTPALVHRTIMLVGRLPLPRPLVLSLATCRWPAVTPTSEARPGILRWHVGDLPPRHPPVRGDHLGAPTNQQVPIWLPSSSQSAACRALSTDN